MVQEIYNLDIIHYGSPVPFVINSMEKITEEYGRIAEDPHRHNPFHGFTLFQPLQPF